MEKHGQNMENGPTRSHMGRTPDSRMKIGWDWKRASVSMLLTELQKMKGKENSMWTRRAIGNGKK